LNTITRRESELQRRLYSGLSVAIVALVLVILLSAAYRLNLAMEWHGFSRLRLYPRVFLIWVGILFAVVVALEIFQRERYFAFAALLAAFGFAISLCLVNVDARLFTITWTARCWACTQRHPSDHLIHGCRPGTGRGVP